ncbi:MAG: protein-L-isoaspartate(D-aspartate) O-methyltransferase [Archangium sp.]|nr:protein-L-isoaspartate(D-aspartate) O-methyltransferase [Archangium sp.]
MTRTGFVSIVLVASQVVAQQPESWRRELTSAGVRDARILEVMEQVKRSDFLPKSQLPFVMEDRPLPIGHEQTTSQPSLIALMMQDLRLKPGCTVLEVGTGSGYQTALLARLCTHVYSIDIVEPLALEAKRRLAALGYANVQVKAGDGYLGWPEHAPFDGIIVCAAASKVPQPLLAQLKKGGRMVIPVGESSDSQLVVFEKDAAGKVSQVKGIPVRFVPLIGDNAERDRRN